MKIYNCAFRKVWVYFFPGIMHLVRSQNLPKKISYPLICRCMRAYQGGKKQAFRKILRTYYMNTSPPTHTHKTCRTHLFERSCSLYRWLIALHERWVFKKFWETSLRCHQLWYARMIDNVRSAIKLNEPNSEWFVNIFKDYFHIQSAKVFITHVVKFLYQCQFLISKSNFLSSY